MTMPLPMRFLAAFLVALVLAAAPVPAQDYTSRRTGLQVDLPPEWEGPTLATEDGLPAYASYVFENANAESDLSGVVLRIDRVVGLDPVRRERWLRGQSEIGYHGARPVSALPPDHILFRPGTALLAKTSTTTSLVFFTVRDGAHYAVQVEAPTARFDALQVQMLNVARGVTLTGGPDAAARPVQRNARRNR